MQFEKHYTREQARALLPEIRQWLKKLVELRAGLSKSEEGLSALATPGGDLGGDLVNRWVRILSGIQDVLLEFYRREIQIKDLDRGLVDFPAILGGKEVFLCWEQGEEDIEFWHALDTGYAGRERL
ncbi:MAG TPA: DUF2203 domain-containing protein [Dongiaceae bacterium]|nr:DUF2203 domain-containing protein [Dongiaceae bacterium]